jgi:hypothetical protein
MCPVLEELFLVVKPVEVDQLPPLLALCPTLLTVHINVTSAHTESAIPLFTPAKPHLFAQELPSWSRITQLGFNTRVWQVTRTVKFREEADGQREMYIETSLSRYENPDVPEQFMVVRA